ncbi:MAG: ATP-binding cassette domain-containing protein [Gammaproteobacteria bacterium]|nr:ATP-binding cassette domain-containing protein [Gammaproteobacteria bacterium]
MKKLIIHLLFRDISPLLKKSKQRIVNQEDFLNLPDSDQYKQTEYHPSNFQLTEQQHLFKDVIRKSQYRLWIIFFLNILVTASSIAVPVLLTGILESFDQSTNHMLYWLSALLLLTFVIKSFINAHTLNYSQRYTIILRRELFSKVLMKLVKDGMAANGNSSGNIQNILHNDTVEIANLPKAIIELILTIILVFAYSILLYMQLGSVILFGIAILIGSIFVQTKLMNYLNAELNKATSYSDERLSKISELLSKIKLIRATGYSSRFSEKITDSRNKEAEKLYRCNLAYVFIQLTLLSMPLLMSMTTFSIYILNGNTLTTAQAFSVIALFSMLRNPMLGLNGIVWEIGRALIGLKRFTTYMRSQHNNVDNKNASLSEGEIVLHNVTLQSHDKSILHDVSISIEPGELIGICGKTGEGKSTFLDCIAGYIPIGTGQIKHNGRMSHLQHHMWLTNDTLKNNILFGQKFDPTRYDKIVDACHLKQDIEALPAGENTIVGEFGARLSGGQKQRIALARTLYANANILLLDNPISALDPSMAKTVFQSAIKSNEGVTRIITTHDERILSQCDRAFNLNNGRLEPLDLSAIKNHELPTVNQADEKTNSAKVIDKHSEEEIETGNVQWSTVSEVFSHTGKIGMIVLTVLVLAATELLRLGSEYWIAVSSKNPNFSSGEVLNWYWVIGVLTLLCIFISQMLILTRMTNHTRNSHKKLLERVLSAPLSFFDSVPQGRILNRFSADIDACSGALLGMAAVTITIFSSLIVQIGFIGWQIPQLTILVLVVGIFYWRLQVSFRLSSREIRRNLSVLRSPLYSSVGETINGAQFIRLNQLQAYSVHQVLSNLGNTNKAEYTENLLNCWLNLRQGLLSALIVGCILVFTITDQLTLIGSFAITYGVLASNTIAQLIFNLTNLEKEMNSAWRVAEYCRLEQETNIEQTIEPPSEDVELEFKNISLIYPMNQHQALNNISFRIERQTKIGVCGRSGSGKSSIVNALLDLYPVTEGEILINQIPATSLRLEHRRHMVSSITQTPFVFSGKVIENICPEHKCSEYDVDSLLKELQLKDVIEKLPQGLETDMSKACLSAGEIQLLVIARVILEHRPVIVLDEAMSDMDPQLMSRVKQVLYKNRPDATYLIISHHYDALLEAEKIYVMEQGRIVETGTPMELSQSTSSKFYKLFTKDIQMSISSTINERKVGYES